MNAYKESKEQFNVESIKSLGMGSSGSVYELENGDALKYYVNGERTHTPKHAIRKIKNLDLSNIYKIKEILYDKKSKLTRKTIGYTMERYIKAKIDLCTCDTSFIIENFENTKKDFQKLSENNVEVNDLHTENVIVTQDKIVIIDADNYKNSLTKIGLFKNNLEELTNLYLELIRLDFIYYHRDDNNFREKLNYISSMNSKLKTRLQFLEDLKNYNNVLDYLNDILERRINNGRNR